MNSPISTSNCLKNYIWGEGCEGWNFIEEKELSIKQERMPAGTSEALHYHARAVQFFCVLAGEASFTIENSETLVGPRQGIRISPEQKHFISNRGDVALEFLLISTPSTANDHINI